MQAQAEANPSDSPAHAQCSSCLNGDQMILMSFGDVIIFLLMHLGRRYKRKACKSLGTVIWFSGTKRLGQLLRGHQPSTLAISVPLMEQKYIPVELCALFIHLHVPRLVLDTLS